MSARSKVEQAVADHAGQFGHGQFTDIQAHARAGFAVAADLLLEHARVGGRSHVAQFDTPAFATGGLLCAQLRRIELTHGVLRLDQQCLAGGGQVDLALAALEQAYAQFALHVLDLAAESGRGDPQLLGGTGEMTVAGDAEEIAEMADFHGCYLQGNDAGRRG